MRHGVILFLEDHRVTFLEYQYTITHVIAAESDHRRKDLFIFLLSSYLINENDTNVGSDFFINVLYLSETLQALALFAVEQ